ncbi:hypothetical protein FVE85_0831 [Porphyridium purpureum]|uniref:Uncharacterized protein n=1 Tax=Porphyridium purpureum TaxID=35688 RepID=A0A5J4Z1R9_PORPP|nr:hypothetical protein FVE85_0831 [Porphyridium purpureum]|eukprot:POR0823..scf208_2
MGVVRMSQWPSMVRSVRDRDLVLFAADPLSTFVGKSRFDAFSSRAQAGRERRKTTQCDVPSYSNHMTTGGSLMIRRRARPALLMSSTALQSGASLPGPLLQLGQTIMNVWRAARSGLALLFFAVQWLQKFMDVYKHKVALLLTIYVTVSVFWYSNFSKYAVPKSELRQPEENIALERDLRAFECVHCGFVSFETRSVDEKGVIRDTVPTVCILCDSDEPGCLRDVGIAEYAVAHLREDEDERD